MASNDLTSQGDFNAKISDAVDDLFNAVRQIEIDPATNEVKELGPPTAKAANKAPALELEKKGKAAPAPAAAAAPQSYPILAKLDQSLMTLDWEVSRSNAGNMRDLLDKAAREYDLGPLVGEGGVISLMHQILAVMSDAPESVPTSGPLALKSSLSALRVAALEGQPYSSETRKKLEQAQNALLSVLPAQSNAPAAATQQAPAAPRAAAALPPEFQVCLKNHIARLDLLLAKRLVPVEKFFSKTASLAKLHVLLNAVRQQLAEQSDQLKAALAGRYTNVMPVTDPVAITIKLGNECQMLMQYHLQVLNHCARRIAPIEKLFADMEGQQKLHAIHFEIRSGLMTQLHYLAAALDGDFGPLPPLPKLAAAPPRPAVPSQPQSAAAPQPVVASPGEAACPWPTLMVARWRGEHVAFIPEQVSFEGKGGFGAGNISRHPSLKLHKLKSWPWSSLKSRCKNGLAEKTAQELASLEFPVLDLPVAAAGLDGKHVVVLFQEAKGGVVLVDSPLEDLEVGDQYQWQPAVPGEADIVSGAICSDFGDPIPVVDICRL